MIEPTAAGASPGVLAASGLAGRRARVVRRDVPIVDSLGPLPLHGARR
jgi:hypothetical protein